jgi:tRNA 2-thiouridine synthesizing protein E
MADDSNDMTDKEKMEYVFRVHEDEYTVDDWDRNVATSLAREEKIDLTDDHWEVVSYLRKLFDGTGEIEHARDLSAVLDQRFKDKGGLKHLFRLFPNGPVTQGCKIAGIPVPKDSTNASFGNVS